MGKETEEKKTEKTCFVIMPISDHPNYPKGHFTKIYDQIFKPAIIEAGFVPHRVDEDKISSDIMAKILEGVTKSDMAICDLSSRNPNVMYELGLRHAYGKPVVLICDNKTDRIFDVSGINTIQYKSERLYEDVIAAREEIKDAIISTEKEPHSILNIAKIQAADIHSNDNIDGTEYIKIMLSSIMKELDDLKQGNLEIAATNNRAYIPEDTLEKMLEVIRYELSHKKTSKSVLIDYLKDIEFAKEMLSDYETPAPYSRERYLIEFKILEKLLRDKIDGK